MNYFDTTKLSNQKLILHCFSDTQNHDFQLEEDIECEKMSVMGYPTCSFIYSTPGTYLESYPRDYYMMTNAKVDGKLFLFTYLAPGGQFDEFEQNAVQMINSTRIPGVPPNSGLTA